MASDFYKRTKDLFEEFQKRELQRLNAERAARSHIQVFKENSMPVHEYLEKLNKREKENEEAYLGLMRHVEQLDHRTENITDNLQKLESLQTAMSSKASMWLHSKNTYDGYFPDYTISSNALRTDNILTDAFSHPNQFQSSTQKVVECASTQTDLMFCKNCQFPVTVFTEMPYDSLSLKNPLNTVTQPFQNSRLFSERTAPLKGVLNKDETSLNLEKLPVATQSLSKILEETPVQNETSLDKYQTISTDISLPMPLNTKFPENEISTSAVSAANDKQPKTHIPAATCYKENIADESLNRQLKTDIPTATCHKENIADESLNKQLKNDIPTATYYKENVADESLNKQLKTDVPTASDYKQNIVDERLNEKVNILNFNKKENDINLHSRVVSEVFDHSEVNKGSGLDTSILVDDVSTLSLNQNVSQIDSEGEISTSKNNARKSALNQDSQIDKRSESPISVEGAPSQYVHSDNVSAVSDSDSSDEKERLKESAAYQTMLGNVTVPKKIQKTTKYSESESEDEVERALATATRKSSSVPTSTAIQEEKPDDSRKNDAAEPKAKNEPRKSISLSKSQQLSKSTRKVLGLDTSSGSEGEIRNPVETSKKIEEDSDEFDFYD